MTPQDLATDSRPLSDFEEQYVAWLIEEKPRLLLDLSIWGFVLAIFGLPVAFMFINHDDRMMVMTVMLVLGAVILGTGILMPKFGWSSQTASTGQAVRITGRLMASGTPGGKSIPTHWIDDFFLVFPREFDSLLFKSYVHQPVELVAAPLSRSKPFFNISHISNRPQTIAIVLSFYDKLNIRGAVGKYGIGFIKKDFYRMIAAGIALALLIIGVTAFAIPDISPSFWVIAGIYAGGIAGFVGSLMLLSFLADRLGKTAVPRGLMKARVPHMEKLKG